MNTGTPEPQAPTTLPDLIEIGGVQYSTRETPAIKDYLDAFRKKISTEERRKVYSQIEELKKSLDQLNKVPLNSASDDLSAFKDEILQSVQSVIKEVVSPVLEHVKKTEEDSVTSYRNKLLIDNQGKCMPELVVGNTKEELDAALVKSLELYNNYVAKNGAPANSTPAVPTTVSASANPTAPASVPATPMTPAAPAPMPLPSAPAVAVAQPEETDIRSMSAEEFGKRRTELEDKIRGLLS
jgi:hypothetical protein